MGGTLSDHLCFMTQKTSNCTINNPCDCEQEWVHNKTNSNTNTTWLHWSICQLEATISMTVLRVYSFFSPSILLPSLSFWAKCPVVLCCPVSTLCQPLGTKYLHMYIHVAIPLFAAVPHILQIHFMKSIIHEISCDKRHTVFFLLKKYHTM